MAARKTTRKTPKPKGGEKPGRPKKPRSKASPFHSRIWFANLSRALDEALDKVDTIHGVLGWQGKGELDARVLRPLMQELHLSIDRAKSNLEHAKEEVPARFVERPATAKEKAAYDAGLTIGKMYSPRSRQGARANG